MEKGDPVLERLTGTLTEIQLLQLEIHFIKEKLTKHIDSVERQFSARRSYIRDLSIAGIAAMIGACASLALTPPAPSSAGKDAITIVPKPKDAKPTDMPFVPQG